MKEFIGNILNNTEGLGGQELDECLKAINLESEQCFDCDEYSDVEWCEILTTEDDGFSIPLCESCMDKRLDD